MSTGGYRSLCVKVSRQPPKEHSLPNNDSLTAVSGLSVGHWTDGESPTGCTVVICPPEGAVASGDVRGGAPGTRNTDLLRPGHLVERVHAILLTGGSEFGHEAAAGVVRWLREKGHGFPYPTGTLPVVCGAVIFDRSIGDPERWPGAEGGYAACQSASAGPVEEGSVGSGAGATVAKAGLARTIRPAHSPVDGDTVFTLATCANNSPTDLLQLGTLAGRAVERAIVRAVVTATGVAGIPSAREWMDG